MIFRRNMSGNTKLKVSFLGLGIIMGTFISWIVNHFYNYNGLNGLVIMGIGALVLIGLFSINRE